MIYVKLMQNFSLHNLLQYYEWQKQPLQVFYKKDILKNFTKFTGKHLCLTLFLQASGLQFYLKRDYLAQVFSCEFCEIFKNTFFTEYLWTTAPRMALQRSKSCSIFHGRISKHGKTSALILQCLVSTKRSHILKQSCRFQLQVCLSMCDLLVDIRH